MWPPCAGAVSGAVGMPASSRRLLEGDEHGDLVRLQIVDHLVVRSGKLCVGDQACTPGGFLCCPSRPPRRCRSTDRGCALFERRDPSPLPVRLPAAGSVRSSASLARALAAEDEISLPLVEARALARAARAQSSARPASAQTSARSTSALACAVEHVRSVAEADGFAGEPLRVGEAPAAGEQLRSNLAPEHLRDDVVTGREILRRLCPAHPPRRAAPSDVQRCRQLPGGRRGGRRCRRVARAARTRVGLHASAAAASPARVSTSQADILPPARQTVSPSSVGASICRGEQRRAHRSKPARIASSTARCVERHRVLRLLPARTSAGRPRRASGRRTGPFPSRPAARAPSARSRRGAHAPARARPPRASRPTDSESARPRQSRPTHR